MMITLNRYRNFDDVKEDLNDCKEHICEDKEYHWWTGVIDCCHFCGVITVDQKWELLGRLEDIRDKR